MGEHGAHQRLRPNTDAPARIEKYRDLSSPQGDVRNIFRITSVGHRDYVAVVACSEGIWLKRGTNANVKVNCMYNRKRSEDETEERAVKTGAHS